MFFDKYYFKKNNNNKQEEAQGYAGQGQWINIPGQCAAVSGHGTEGRPSDPLPLEERYGQCSRHACNQHSHQVPLCEKPREVFTGGGEGEEEDVP